MATRNPVNSPVEGKVVYPIIYPGFYCGCLGFQPSTVATIFQPRYHESQPSGVHLQDRIFVEILVKRGIFLKKIDCLFQESFERFSHIWQDKTDENSGVLVM